MALYLIGPPDQGNRIMFAHDVLCSTPDEVRQVKEQAVTEFHENNGVLCDAVYMHEAMFTMIGKVLFSQHLIFLHINRSLMTKYGEGSSVWS